MYVAAAILVTAWELAESYPVKPVAAMIQEWHLSCSKVYTSYAHGRPSLNFF